MSSGFAMSPSLVLSGRNRLLVTDPELTHQPEHVGLEPGRHDLPAGELAKGDLAEVDGAPRRRYPEQLAEMRPRLAEAADDEIALGDGVLDGHVEVRERLAKEAC